MHVRKMILTVVSLVPGLMTSALSAQDGNGRPATPVTIVSPNPVPVTGTVQAQQSGNWTVGLSGTPTVTLSPTGTPLPVVKVLPSTAFTIPPTQLPISPTGSTSQKPDPSGTRYAITSVVVSNPTNNMAVLTLTAFSYPGSANCGDLVNVIASAPGPKVTVAPNSTGSLTFPQPYVTDAVTGGVVCLAGGGSNGLGTTWSVVGYKILP